MRIIYFKTLFVTYFKTLFVTPKKPVTTAVDDSDSKIVMSFMEKDICLYLETAVATIQNKATM